MAFNSSDFAKVQTYEIKLKLHISNNYTVTRSVGVLTKFHEDFFCFIRTVSRDETYNAFVPNKIIYYLGSM